MWEYVICILKKKKKNFIELTFTDESLQEHGHFLSQKMAWHCPLGLKVQQALKGGRSLTTLTRFWPFLTTYLLMWEYVICILKKKKKNFIELTFTDESLQEHGHFLSQKMACTLPIAELLCVKNGRAIVVCGFIQTWVEMGWIGCAI